MKEDLLQFIWQHKLLKPEPLYTVSGKEVKIIKPGELNLDSGPDFFNARLQIDGLVLAGNVEVHVNSSDWLKHKHQNDRAYDSIILHVVYNHDKTIEQNHLFNVEVLELNRLVSDATLNTYDQLLHSRQELPCAKQLQACNDTHVLAWLERMLVERLEKKETAILQLFKSLDGNYTQTFFVLLLRAYGFHVNAPAFELLARQLPVPLLLRHADHLTQTEALLLGMTGLLEESFEEKYPRTLQNEFEFLKQKYQLIPLDKKVLKYSRLRPGNFPDLRLAQLAALLHRHPEFLQAPQEFCSPEMVLKALQTEVSTYWQSHYRLGSATHHKSGSMGKDSVELLIINTLVPFLFFYANKQNQPLLKTKALQLLEQCSFENNRKTRLFSAKKKVLRTAQQSQACINLFEGYCSKKACLSCGIAAALLKDH